MIKQWEAKWLTDPAFIDFEPLHLLHKEMSDFPAFHHPVGLRNHHMLVRKTFECGMTPNEAYLDITADDYYKLYINGVFVAQGPSQGYSFHYYYNQIDVKRYLRVGRNVIAVHVYYVGHVNRAMNSGDLRQGMIAELRVDGRVAHVTDETWKFVRTFEYGDGLAETIGNETQVLEHIDSRLRFPGWKESDYDDSGWKPAALKQIHGYTLVEQPTPTLEVRNVEPSDVRKLGQGHYLIDFGTEITGQFTMRAYGASGDCIEIRCGEELSDDGEHVRYEMRCNCRYREIWTLSGRVEEPDFYDYKAFRFVEVIGPERAIDAASFAAIVRHYPMDPDACRFETSDDRLHGIWSICRNGVLYCAQEAFLDCPSREKGAYLGDATVMGHSHLYLSGDSRLVRKTIRDYALSSAICPGLMAVAPGSFMQEIADFSCQWPLQLLTYYRFSGDEAFLREMYPYAEVVIDYFRQYSRSDGLLERVDEKWNLVDWPDEMRDGYHFPLAKPVGEGCHNVMNAYYYGCLKAVQDIRDILRIPYRDELPELKRAFIDAFWNAGTGLFVDAVGSAHSALHSNVFPLYFGIVPKDSVPGIVRFIRKKRLSCGVYFSYFLLKALAEAGEHELAYDLITCDDERSWSNMLREGATACFEAWGKDQKWNTSLCHGWASAPIAVLIEDIIGLKPAEPGWRKVSFTPHLPASMPSFQLEMTVPTGKISVRYKDGIVWTSLTA
ncbi:family 78 glycoside hydrolase catalytic domain [Paenibacillus sedimenti]|uniref:alpha-L-rhamnosidase n=1 Tax=Paenibacillus sedimenti TaxID=2770274 RepID=A0A926KLY0_9BACL|nr:family 78 glycoside hydrolase catalytic domain [Paenibacillus sedimenti]MBD0378554.1 family 78 glycoside hydrolase catalytic domain [Paenibacillus sedimenti]